MDGQLVLQYIDVLLWPGITVYAIALFRKQVGGLITNIGNSVHRVKKVTAKGATVELTELQGHISQLSHSTTQVVPEAKALTDGADDVTLEDLTTGRIHRLWHEIEDSVDTLFDRHKEIMMLPTLSSGKARPLLFMDKVRALGSRRIIPRELTSNIGEARRIRSLILHRQDLPVGSMDDYLATITNLNTFLHLLADSPKSVESMSADQPTQETIR